MCLGPAVGCSPPAEGELQAGRSLIGGGGQAWLEGSKRPVVQPLPVVGAFDLILSLIGAVSQPIGSTQLLYRPSGWPSNSLVA